MFCNVCKKDIKSTESYCEIHLSCFVDGVDKSYKYGELPKLKITEEDISVIEDAYEGISTSIQKTEYRRVLHKLIAMKVLQEQKGEMI